MQRRLPTHPLAPVEVAEAVARHYQVTIAQIVRRGRADPAVMRARQVAHALSVQLGRRSLSEVGLVYDRDATTIHYSQTLIREQLLSDPELRDEVASIRASLGVEEVSHA